jgi:hypothetical protein
VVALTRPPADWDSQPHGSSAESTPPVTTIGVPLRMVRRACPIASSPPACSATMAMPGPRSALRIEIWPVVTA